MDTPINFKLLLVVSDNHKRQRLLRVYRSQARFQIAGAGPTLIEAYLSTPLAFLANTLLVDLVDPQTANSEFWILLRVRFPAAKIIALAAPPVNEVALLAALHAGVCMGLRPGMTQPKGCGKLLKLFGKIGGFTQRAGCWLARNWR